MARIGLSMTSEQLTALLKTHQASDHIPEDAKLSEWDRDVVTGEFLFVFESEERGKKPGEQIKFPQVTFKGAAITHHAAV
jgi:hypothetical protein